MNPTLPTSPADGTDKELAAGLAGQEYVRRAQEVVSGGAKTTSFDSAAREYSGLETMLHGDKPPSQVINVEQPIHVLMCYMISSGKTPAEVAVATNYSIISVRNIMRQPWFRKRFLGIAGEAGRDSVKAFLDGEVMPSLEILVEIRDDNKELRPHVSAAAANSILDRALGKPVAKMETQNHNYDHGKTVEEVDQQLQAVQEELKSRGHAGSN